MCGAIGALQLYPMPGDSMVYCDCTSYQDILWCIVTVPYAERYRVQLLGVVP